MKSRLKRIPVQFLLLGTYDKEDAEQHEGLPRGSGGVKSCLAKTQRYLESMQPRALLKLRWTIYLHGDSAIRRSRREKPAT